MSGMNRLAARCAKLLDQDQEFFAETERGRSVSWDGGTLKSVESERDAGAGLRVLSDQKLGFAYANQAELDAEELTKRARQAQSMMPADQHHQLPDPPDVSEEVRQWYDDTIESPPDARVRTLGETIQQYLDENDLETMQVSYGESDHTRRIYRQGQFCVGEKTTRYQFGVWAICGEGGETRTGYEHQSAPTYEALQPDRVLSAAIRRARRQLGSTPPETHSGTVLITEQAASGLLRLAAQMLDGEALVKGRSAWDLETRGEKVGSSRVTLIDDPSRSGGGLGREFDAEGYRMEPVTLVEEGVLQRFLSNQYTSSRSGCENTHRAQRDYRSRPGVGTSNFYLRPGEASFDELIAELGEGPVVTAIQPGSGLDPVGGHFSVRAKGYQVKEGRPAEPFHEATLSGSMESLLHNIRALGDTLPTGYTQASPSMLVESMTLGGG